MLRPESFEAIEWWHWPQILSIEAPLVAVLWTRLVARSFGQRITPLSLAMLGLSAWIIYMGDRWLDATLHAASDVPAHRFYRRYLGILRTFIATTFVAVILLSWKTVPPGIIRAEALVAVGTALYLLRVHLPRFEGHAPWPRELAVGLLFAAAVCAPACALGADPWRVCLDFLVFAVLVFLNGTAIKFWTMAPIRRHKVTLWTGRRITVLGALFAGLLLIFHSNPVQQPVLFAASLSALFISMLPVVGQSWRPNLWSAAADAALLTPLLLPVFW